MVTQKNFAFYSTEIQPTVSPATASPAPVTLVVLDQPPIFGTYDFDAGEMGRGSVIQTLGGVVIQDFGVTPGDGRISFSENDALTKPVKEALDVIHKVVDGEYFFTDGFKIWRVRFARPNGFKARKNLLMAQYADEPGYPGDRYSYEINLIVVAELVETMQDFKMILEVKAA
jgi:hypothetical protein